jgi:thioredoxin-like negative regulator of GroEL
MKNSLLLTAFLFATAFACHAVAQTGSNPKLRSADALSTHVQKNQHIFSADLKPGFHFNDKAPNSLEVDGQPQTTLKFAKSSVQFRLPKTWHRGQASLYVCDDAVTFCEVHSIPISAGGASDIAPVKSKAAVVTKPVSSKPNKFGFIIDDFQSALTQAKAKHQFVMADFSARWCPGCVRYEKDVFSTKRFAEISKDLVKVKVDVDQFANFPLVEKYAIHGIPTVILMTDAGDEIQRVVDFQPLSRLEILFASLQQNATPMKDLLAVTSPTDAQRLLIGQRLLASGDAPKALSYLEKVKPVPAELYSAKIAVAEKAFETDKDANKAALASALEEAIKHEPQSTRSIAWRTELIPLIDNKPEVIKSLFSDGRSVADKSLKDTTFLTQALTTEQIGEFVGYERLWVALLNADLTEAAEAKGAASADDVATAWKQAADIGASYKISAENSGPALRYLIVLSAAKNYADADKMADAILKVDPNNVDVKRRKLKVLLGLSKPAEAAKLGEQILPQAEGRNQFWVAESLAKAYIALNKKPEAKRLLTAYLARPEINEEKMKPSKKSLEELLKSTN